MINRLEHVEVGVADLERAADFYVGVLGFLEYERTDEALYLRAVEEFDAWSLKLAKRDGPGLVSFGFRVGEPGDLEELRGVHDRLELEHTTLPDGFEPGRGEGLRIRRPEGYVIDFYHEIEEVDLYGASGAVEQPGRRRGVHRGLSPIELDHVNYRHPNVSDTYDYFINQLGFSCSEMALDKDGELMAAWVRRKRTTHDVALVTNAETGVHHFSYLVEDPGSLIRIADALGDNGHSDNLQYGPVRHGVSNAMTMYFLDPDGNRIETFTGDNHRDLDRAPIQWAYDDYVENGRFWWGARPAEGYRDQVPFLDADWPSKVPAGNL